MVPSTHLTVLHVLNNIFLIKIEVHILVKQREMTYFSCKTICRLKGTHFNYCILKVH